MKYKVTGKNILVTGGTGFIGHYLVERLDEMGNKVWVLTRNTSNGNKLVDKKNVEIVKGDLSNVDSFSDALNAIDIVYHLAAKLHVPLNSKDPELNSVNVNGTKNLLDACISKGVSKFVFFSSTAVCFGNLSDIAMDELTPPNPAGKYGESKLKAGKLVEKYNKEHKLDTTILMPVVVYGKGEIGNVTKLIDYIKKRRFILIGNGSTVRSIVYVKNVVNAALCVTENPKANGETYILTDKDNYTLKEMAEFISAKCNVPLYKFHIPVSLAYCLALMSELIGKCFSLKMPFTRDIIKRLTTNQICSSRKIQEELGFSPTTFEEGMSENLELY